jgi:hypothetical protein
MRPIRRCTRSKIAVKMASRPPFLPPIINRQPSVTTQQSFTDLPQIAFELPTGDCRLLKEPR